MPLLNSNDQVVVPWDFSEHSRQALDRAFSLVSNTQQIHIVHVAHLPIMVGPGMNSKRINPQSVVANARLKFEESVKDDPRCQELSFTTLIEEEQGRTICDFAETMGAALIVISTHGRSGLEAWQIGSVTERVVRYAPCDVLVVRSGVGKRTA